MRHASTIFLLLTILFILLAAFTLWGVPRLLPRPAPEAPISAGQAVVGAFLTVAQSGVTTVTAEELRRVGLPVERLSPAAVALSRDGRATPFVVDEPGDRLFFFAEATGEPFDPPAVYRLTLAAGTAMPMRDAPAPADAPAAPFAQRAQRWESNSTFLPQATGGDVWLGPLLWAPTTLDLPLDGIRPQSDRPAHLAVRLWSDNAAPVDPDHHLRAALNGVWLIDAFWDGATAVTLETAVPAGVLRETDNRLTFDAPGDTGAPGEAIYIDWVELTYDGRLTLDAGPVQFRSAGGTQRIDGLAGSAVLLDVRDPAAPVHVRGAAEAGGALRFTAEPGGVYAVATAAQVYTAAVAPTYAWETPLRAAGRGAEYVAIVAAVDGFAAALEPLRALRAQQGWRTAVISTAQIDDEFGHGRHTAAAVRAFLAYAAAHWSPPPRFVLLVGDASYDVHDHSGGAQRNWLATHHTFTRHAGYVADDGWLATPEGAAVPQAALGRWPAQTAQQVATIVAKTLAYETAEPAAWLGRALLVADDEPRFDAAADQLAAQLTAAGYQTAQLHRSREAALRDALLVALDEGVGLLAYVGHGSLRVWGEERFFGVEDVDGLRNGARLPIFATFTCLNGYFNHPDAESLAERLLWTAEGGSVAAIAPSGRTTTGQQMPLAETFYAVLASGAAETLGEALLQAKQRHAADPALRDALHTFNLLGDPALRVRLPTRP